MIFDENRLPADDSHEISCLICYFCKSGKILNCRLLQIIGGALRDKYHFLVLSLWHHNLRCFMQKEHYSIIIRSSGALPSDY